MSLNGCTQINIFAFLQVYDLQICVPDFPRGLMPKRLPLNCFFFADENVALKYLVECIHMKLIHNAGFSRPYLLLSKCLLLPALKCIIQHSNHKLLATCTSSFQNGKHPIYMRPVSLLQGNGAKNYSSESSHLRKHTNFTLGFTRTIPVRQIGGSVD